MKIKYKEKQIEDLEKELTILDILNWEDDESAETIIHRNEKWELEINFYNDYKSIYISEWRKNGTFKALLRLPTNNGLSNEAIALMIETVIKDIEGDKYEEGTVNDPKREIKLLRNVVWALLDRKYLYPNIDEESGRTSLVLRDKSRKDVDEICSLTQTQVNYINNCVSSLSANKDIKIISEEKDS